MRAVGKFLYGVIAFIIKHTPGWNTKRVRVVITNDNNEVLLIRNWLSNHNWSLPGGGIERNETPEHAAVREIKEETNLTITHDALRFVTTTYSEALKADLVILHAYSADSKLLPLDWQYRLEIMDRQWHPVDKLPTDMSEITKHAIALALDSEN